LPNGIVALLRARKPFHSIQTPVSTIRGWAESMGRRWTTPSFIIAARLAGKVRNEFEATVRLNPKSVDARADLADFCLEAPGIVGSAKDKAEGPAQEIAKFWIPPPSLTGWRLESQDAEGPDDF
jgi:hypothetical protein